MKNFKRIVFPFISLFLGYRTFELLNDVLRTTPQSYSQGESFLIALLIALFITGVYAMIGFAYPTHQILPGSYFRVHNPKRLKQIGKQLGLELFKKFLLAIFWGKEKNRKKYFNGTKSGFDNFIYQTKQSEIGHLLAFFSLIAVSIFLLINDYYLIACYSIIINILGNLYPVILQRMHRSRLDFYIKKGEAL